MHRERLPATFFTRDVLEVAPGLLGQYIARNSGDGLKYYMITETEAYRGTGDLACHASKGRTPRTEVMFATGGVLYVYLVYGMHWMLNVVTGERGNPQAVLIRGIEEATGPGRVTKRLHIDRDFYGEDLGISDRIWIVAGLDAPGFTQTPRVGIDYAGEPWVSMPWRYCLDHPGRDEII